MSSVFKRQVSDQKEKVPLKRSKIKLRKKLKHTCQNLKSQGGSLQTKYTKLVIVYVELTSVNEFHKVDVTEH